ncbi:hypothetical protein CSIM01_13322 [Colletotrichum simmondsii]|uniref:Uncharacterized protein n=1 Tax=Colletotrichum simmondsii TaxID=703756 RepID=A0A135TYH7_9PEZI|nr:hypothetical protein CSIM01_13322 [Colletotrichum simmondsii]
MGTLLASATQQPENASTFIVENANNVKKLTNQQPTIIIRWNSPTAAFLKLPTESH